MTLEETKRLSKHICRLLKVLEIQYPIGRTPKGNFTLRFNAINDDFDLMLDSVQLSTTDFLNDENNIALKAMVEKYWFDQETKEISILGVGNGTLTTIESVKNEEISLAEPKKKGRPKKVVE